MKWKNENCSEKQLYDFLKKVDQDFPIPLSTKVNLREYAKKLRENGTLCTELWGDEVVGMVAGYTENLKDGMAYIAVVGVVKKAQRQGIAAKLLHEFFEICSKKGIGKVHLYSDARNVGAIHMYEKLGFEMLHLEMEPRPEDVHFGIDIVKTIQKNCGGK